MAVPTLDLADLALLTKTVWTLSFFVPGLHCGTEERFEASSDLLSSEI